MGLKTKYFGKKIEGKSLNNLLSQIGQDAGSFEPKSSKWSQDYLFGRCDLSPSEEGIKVNLYVFSGTYHIQEEREAFPGQKDKSEKVKHFQGEIKYSDPGESN